MDEDTDIDAWIGKVPTKDGMLQDEEHFEDMEVVGEDSSAAASIVSVSSDEDMVDIPHQPESAITIGPDDETRTSSDDQNDVVEVRPPFQRQENLNIDLPELDPYESDDFSYLPGHFEVRKVLVALSADKDAGSNRKYLVRLGSGEIDLVERIELVTQLHRGKVALNEYNKLRFQKGARKPRQPPLLENGNIDWQRLHYTDSESNDEDRPRKQRKIYTEEQVSDLEPVASSGDDFEDSEHTRPQGRRSTRLAPRGQSSLMQEELRGLLSSDDEMGIGKGTRSAGRPSKQESKSRVMASLNPRQRRGLRATSSKERTEQESGARRSERTRQQPRRNMRERNEDELSSQSEKGLGPKIVATKEIFIKLTPSDPFRKRHQQECSTCYHVGDNDIKGPLVFCQGCSNAYHKRCLGPRGSRDHLVTKVGDGLFALQCRRCIGIAREKDPTAPHYGRCSGCDKLGQLSKPLRKRLTTRQEQVQRDENGGIDPITITQPGTVNSIENVMFRCATCSRAWHMHHLPYRRTAHSQPGDSDEEGLDNSTVAQKRFELYHRSWICKDCVENQHTVDTIVAWKPANQETYIPGTTIEQMPESQKEYLLKWKNQSYLRCTWMPGTWVWGIVAGPMRASFLKKTEHQLPRMTTKDAIPEEYHRIDIVFDVRYTSVVRNSSEGIDLARVKEVDTAYVKYKGLGYEDTIWEKPPSYLDTERFKDFKEAYEDFIRKKYMSIPPQSTLRRTLVNTRLLDFETKLIKKTQPSMMTGGQMMQYQVEGHNWLFYQWYRQHNAILADEMGLGKTIQLIALMATLIQQFKCWPFLIVVPNSTCPNWRREIKKWVPGVRAVCYYGSHASRKLTHDYELFPKNPEDSPIDKKKKNEIKDIKAHIVIASYESVVEKSTALSLMRVPWQGLIVDEGQRLKSDKNLVYEGLSKMRFPFKVLMTGTPLQNNARELFNLLQFLDKDKHNAALLEAKYAELTQDNVPELHEMLKPYFLRRTKVQVLTFLPPMSQIILPVSMSALQKKVSKSIMSQNPQLMRSIFSRDTDNIPVKERTNLNNILMQLRKTLCHPFIYSRGIEDRTVDSDTSFKRLIEASPKLQLLSIMLPKLRERGHRVLMFSQFLSNLDIIEDFLDGLGMLHRRLDGTIIAMEKQKRIDEFNAPESPYFAFLLSTRAGGVGINLATADTVIILDPDFNPHQDIQALSRAHRIGQQNKVLVFQLMTRNTAEEKIMQIGKGKMALDHVLIEAMDQEDEAGMDLESILRHGAAALFDDDASAENDIVYTEASVDQLLDRSQIESTKTSDKQSAESQFSYARIWANDKAALEDAPKDSEDSGVSTPNPDIWDNILKERERAYAEEVARKAEELGRGKRRRGRIDYSGKPNKSISDALDVETSAPQDNGDDSEAEHNSAEDDEFRSNLETDIDPTTAGEETEPERPMIKGRAFKRVKVPIGDAPLFNGDPPTYLMTPNAANGFIDYKTTRIPPVHKCSACNEQHPLGWCRLKIAGVEHCGLCGLAHMGHGRTCPHLNNEKQVETLLMTLKESTESLELIDEATKYLRVIRGDLVSQRRIRERQTAMEQNKMLAPNPLQIQGPQPMAGG